MTRKGGMGLGTRLHIKPQLLISDFQWNSIHLTYLLWVCGSHRCLFVHTYQREAWPSQPQSLALKSPLHLQLPPASQVTQSPSAVGEPRQLSTPPRARGFGLGQWPVTLVRSRELSWAWELLLEELREVAGGSMGATSLGMRGKIRLVFGFLVSRTLSAPSTSNLHWWTHTSEQSQTTHA